MFKIFKDKRFGRELPPDFKQPYEKNLSDFYRIERNSMLELEGKRHTRLRGLVLRAFTTKNIQKISKDISKMIEQLHNFPKTLEIISVLKAIDY